MRGLRVLLLGRPRLEVDGQALAADLPLKHQALLYYLAAADGPVARSSLATLLWEDLDEGAARGNLRTALMRLRRSLPGVLATEGRDVGFDPALPLQVDVVDLARAAAAAARTEPDLTAAPAAVAAWRGPLLDGFDLGGEGFERWLAAARQQAAQHAAGLRRRLAEAAAASGQGDAAEAHWRALLEVDDADEPAHMALMAQLAGRGQRTAAIAQYEACRAALLDRLGARPSTACYALYTRIHADAPGLEGAPRSTDARVLVGEGSVAAPKTPAQSAGQPANLPAADDALIGRGEEMALLSDRLADPACRWLTLVGPGGVGKTRLAQAAAARRAAHHRHGLCWLSGRDAGGALRDAETLAQRVLQHTGTDRDTPGALLLVLDNLETVADVPALARGLAARAPGVQVLATSRRRLGVAREWLLELDGLSLQPAEADRPASAPAAQLLAAAVRRVDPRFDPHAEAEAVERLCARVGGLPLALELAARSVQAAGVSAVLARLDAGESWGEAGDADPAAHHASIGRVLDDAWSALPPPAQAAALRLAALPDSFDGDLAAVVGVDTAALDLLRSHSWLRHGGRGLLALHPLQQGFLRRQRGAAAVQGGVHDALVAAIAGSLPASPPPPLGEGQVDEDARTWSERPLWAASVLSTALDRVLQADADAAAAWVDGVGARLTAVDRQAEAAALYARALRRGGWPRWRSAGWQALRAERLNTLGDAVASLQGYEAALCELGLEEATQAASRWRDLPRALWRVWRASDWPQEPAARVAFERVLARALMMYTQQLSFTSSMQRSVRANLMASVHAACAGGAPERQGVRVMSAYGALTMGQARSAAWLLPARRKPAGEPLFDAFAAEGECVTRIALGRWDGVAERLDALHQRMVALGDHRHAMECHSLLAKLLFYRGDLVRAAERFAASTELSLARPGGAWRAWGPFGQAEVAMCTGGVPASDLRRWVDLGSHWMTELVNVDAAYTLRRHGLMARLAWQAGDVAGSREAVLGGVAAAARITHCGFWAQEGFAGIGQVLLALRQREAQAGGAVTPWDKAWQAYARRLHAHGRSFPAGWAMVWRLCGEAAAVQGRPELARRLLGKALRLAERQGLRVELARCFDAQAVLDADAGHDWAARAQRLRREMTAGIPASAHGPGVC